MPTQPSLFNTIPGHDGAPPRVVPAADGGGNIETPDTEPAAPFAEGDRVSLAEYDRYSPPSKRYGVGTVMAVTRRERGCESGWMVTVHAERGAITLDANWLRPVSPR